MKNGVEDFVVESTPVLDLKKNSLGPATTSGANWDADRTEVYTDADNAGSVAFLTGENGESYPITTFPFVMGRGSECDLVMQGKGVSRRHAEIIFQSGRFVVNDLESLNGLKVNGYKVARVILEENDTIRLGDVSLVFQSGAATTQDSKQDSRPSKAKRPLFGGKPKPKPDVEDTTFGPSPFKRALINVSVLSVLAVCGWAGYQYWQQSGLQQTGLQTGLVGEIDHQAMQQPAASAAAPAPSAVAAAPSAGQQGESSVVAENPMADAAQPGIDDAAVAPPPSIAPPPSLAAAPTRAERPAPAPAKTKPKPEQPAAVKAEVEQPRPAVVRAPVPAAPNNTEKARAAMASAQQSYMQGNVETALGSLREYMNDSSLPAAVKGEVQKLHGSLFSQQTLYVSGQAAYDRGDKEAAFNDWTTFMQKESSLFGSRKSVYSRSISSRVVNEYVALGNEAAKAGDHHKAYRMWQKSLELGDNVAAKIAIDSANNRAMQLYRQALRLEYVNTSKAKALWQEVVQLLPPGTEYNTKAGAKLAWYDKWGT